MAVKTEIIIGEDRSGESIRIDMEELLATRLLVQGNSGSGKSHLLRRLLEESADMVQQVIIDPEGDFTSLADIFPHIIIDGATHSVAEIEALARRVREHRASVVLALEGLDVEQQIRCSAQFLGALFDAPREHWYPALVVVDEAQMFAPAISGEISEDTRRLSLNAMTNLMCRGRKRGLAGVVATQRLAKLAKNVAAEASNFLMGRTFLDIDMIRAADLLGMERRQAEQIRDLERGSFLGLGPAISRRPLAVKIGMTRTGSKRNSSGLMPLPTANPEEMAALLHDELKLEGASASAQRLGVPPSPDSLSRNMDILEADPAPEMPAPAPQAIGPEYQSAHSEAEQGEAPEDGPSIDEGRAVNDAARSQQEIALNILRDLAADPGSTYKHASSLFQSFLSNCKAAGAHAVGMDMEQFRRQFSFAFAGIDRLDPAQQDCVKRLSENVESDVLSPYLVILNAALQGQPSPSEAELAAAYGTSSSGRIRRLLEHLEKLGLIIIREDYGGGRTLAVPSVEAQNA